MKSSLFGFNAKIALAAMAICGGLFTSCYEKEDADVNLGDPEYYVAGTITDFATASPITNATVTVGGKTVSAPGGKFSEKVSYTSDDIEVVISATDYITHKEKVKLQTVPNGAKFIATVSVTLVKTDDYQPPVEAKEVVAADWEKAQSALAAATTVSNETKTEIKSTTGNTVGAIDVKALEVGNTTNPISALMPIEYELNPTSLAKAAYVVYNGFSVAGDLTRATDPEILDLFKKGVAAKLGKQIGFIQSVSDVSIPQVANFSIAGITAKYNFTAKKYSIEVQGQTYTGVVTYLENITIYPKYYNHDTHDYHHGGGINGGGGSGGF